MISPGSTYAHLVEARGRGRGAALPPVGSVLSRWKAHDAADWRPRPAPARSTISAEIAHRLDIVRTQSTDMLREVMRLMFPGNGYCLPCNVSS